MYHIVVILGIHTASITAASYIAVHGELLFINTNKSNIDNNLLESGAKYNQTVHLYQTCYVIIIISASLLFHHLGCNTSISCHILVNWGYPWDMKYSTHVSLHMHLLILMHLRFSVVFDWLVEGCIYMLHDSHRIVHVRRARTSESQIS